MTAPRQSQSARLISQVHLRPGMPYDELPGGEAPRLLEILLIYLLAKR